MPKWVEVTVPKISVIIPVYNVEKYLPTCLDSLVNQTFNDIEIICINDGSTDGSLEILHEYAQRDSRMKIISQKNQGVSFSRQVGLNNALGEYIMFCDSDDYYSPDMCMSMYETIQERQVDIVKCNIRCVDDNLTVERVDDQKYYKIPFEGVYKIDSKIMLKTNVSLVSCIFKKELIDKYQIKIPKTLRAHEDDAFMDMYLAISDKIFFLSENLYYYVRRSDSLTPQYRNSGLKNFDRTNLMHEVYPFLKKNMVWNKVSKAFLKKYLFLFRTSFIMAKENQKNDLLLNEKSFSELLLKEQIRSISFKQRRIFNYIKTQNLQKLIDIIPLKKTKFKFLGLPLLKCYEYVDYKKYLFCAEKVITFKKIDLI